MEAILGLMGPLAAVIGAVLRLGRWLAGLALGLMVAVIMLQIFFRYVLGAALPWPAEAARFMMLWMTGLAAPSAYRRGGFVAIDMAVAALPARAGAALSLVLLALSMCVLAMGVGLGLAHVDSGWLFNSGSLALPLKLVGLESVPIKLAWMYMSLLVGMGLLAVVNVELILRTLIALGGNASRLDVLPEVALEEAE